MDEHVQAERTAGVARQASPTAAVRGQGAIVELISPSQLRAAPIQSVQPGAYRSDEVEVLRERAAVTIGELYRRLTSTRDELERLREASQAGDPGDGGTLEAMRKIEAMKAEASREADRLLAAARTHATEARRLHDEAQATLEHARASAAAYLDDARAEHARYLEETRRELERARADLAADRRRVEVEIEHARGSCAASLARALERIEAIRSAMPPHDPSAVIASTSAPEPRAETIAGTPAAPAAAAHELNGHLELESIADWDVSAEPIGAHPESLSWFDEETQHAPDPLEVIAELRSRLSAPGEGNGALPSP